MALWLSGKREKNKNNVRIPAEVKIVVCCLMATTTRVIFFIHHKNYRYFCPTSNNFVERESTLLRKVMQNEKKVTANVHNFSKIFITYSDEAFRQNGNRIIKEAIKCKYFDRVHHFGPNNMTKNFKRSFRDVLYRRRGGGFWAWKPEIISRILRQINTGDFLIYMDAGTTINPLAKYRFIQYLKMVDVSYGGVLAWEWPSMELNWTNDNVFTSFRLGTRSKAARSLHIIATMFIFQKRSTTVHLMEKYMQLVRKDPLLLTDEYNRFTKRNDFIDHRHDQSIFSILLKCHGVSVLPLQNTIMSFSKDEPFHKTHFRG